MTDTDRHQIRNGSWYCNWALSYSDKGGSKVLVLHLCLLKFLLTSGNDWKADTALVPAQGGNLQTITAEGRQNPPRDRIPRGFLHPRLHCHKPLLCTHTVFPPLQLKHLTTSCLFHCHLFVCTRKMQLHKLSPSLRENLHLAYNYLHCSKKNLKSHSEYNALLQRKVYLS